MRSRRWGPLTCWIHLPTLHKDSRSCTCSPDLSRSCVCLPTCQFPLLYIPESPQIQTHLQGPAFTSLSLTCRPGPLIRGPLLPTPDGNSGTWLSTDVQGRHTWHHFPDHVQWRPTSHMQCRQVMWERTECSLIPQRVKGMEMGNDKHRVLDHGSAQERSAWLRVTLGTPVWYHTVRTEPFLWINAQYFLMINDKAKKT